MSQNKTSSRSLRTDAFLKLAGSKSNSNLTAMHVAMQQSRMLNDQNDKKKSK